MKGFCCPINSRGGAWAAIAGGRNLRAGTRSKTAGGEGREIVFTTRLGALLLEMRKDQGLVFTFNGNGIGQVKTAWKAAIRRAGIRRYRFHDLRHTFNT